MVTTLLFVPSFSLLLFGTHRIELTVRYALRLCTLCNGSHIEDEYHFVAICPAYNQLREKYIRPYYYKRPSVYKFTLMMRSTNTTIVKNLAKFVSEAFSFRNTLVN